MLVGYVFRLAFQFIAFVWLARILGVSEFGSLAALLAVVALITPFVELGNYNLIVSDASRGILIPRIVGNSLLLMLFTVPIGFVTIALIHIFFFPNISLIYIIGIGVSELIGGRFWTIASGVHVAQSQLWRNALMEGLAGFSRLFFVYLLLELGGSLTMWIGLLVIHSLVVGAATLVWVIRTWGRPTANWGEFTTRLKPGIHFALGAAAQTAYTDLDKAMLGRLSGFDSVGIYAAAHRIALVSYLPLNALLATTYPKFFEIGQISFVATRNYSLKILRLTLIYGLMASVVLWFAAPLLPKLLGEEFGQSVKALQWLAIIPLIQSLYFPLGDVLTGTGNQGLRSTIQIVSLSINVLLNYAWIPNYSWLGSVWATLVSQTFLVIVVFGLVWIFPSFLTSKNRRNS